MRNRHHAHEAPDAKSLQQFLPYLFSTSSTHLKLQWGVLHCARLRLESLIAIIRHQLLPRCRWWWPEQTHAPFPGEIQGEFARHSCLWSGSSRRALGHSSEGSTGSATFGQESGPNGYIHDSTQSLIEQDESTQYIRYKPTNSVQQCMYTYFQGYGTHISDRSR